MNLSSWFNNIKIKTRLGLVFGFIFIIVASGFIYTQSHIISMKENIQNLHDHPFAVSSAVNNSEIYIVSMHRSMKDVAMAENEGELNAAIRNVNEMELKAYEELGKAKKAFLGNPADVDNLIKILKDWKPIREEVISFTLNNEKQKASQITKGKGAKHVLLMTNAMEDLRIFASEKADEFTDNAIIASDESLKVSYIILIAITLFGIISAYTVTLSITKPLSYALKVANQIASKNLNVELSTKQSNDEVGQLITTFNEMVNNLKIQFLEITEGVNVLSTSSSEIMAMTSQLAAGSAETASSISETTSTIEEVKQTAEIANQKSVEVAESAQKISSVSQDGLRSVEETIDGMNRIKMQMESIAGIVIQLSEKSQAIGEIANNVNDLAEQSNLLAVNASIEAARAGEHGKAFNVVATEIKNLAERSKESTVQIRTIVTDIQKEISGAVMATEQGGKVIDLGLNLSSTSNEVISALATSIEEAAQSNLQIAATSQQQVVGMDQITSAMENIKEASIQTTSSTRQTELSVTELKNLGEKLLAVLNEYELS